MTEGGARPNAQGLSVLVVDDDINMIRLIEAILRDMGVANVDRAKDGRFAIDMLRRYGRRYDLVISDWEMPEIDGLTLLRAVRRISADLPFLMLTVRTGEEAILAAKGARVTGYISKPFKPRDLQTKILTVTGRIAPKEDVVTVC